MKILILSSKVPFPPKDGGAIATLSLAEGLSDVGNEVSILCLNTSKHPFDVRNIPGVLKKKLNFFSIDHDTGINPFRLLLNILFSSEPYNARRFYSRAFIKYLVSLLKDEHYDVIQLEGPYMGYYIDTVRKHATNAMVSLRAHNVEHEIWQRKVLNTRNPFLRLYFVQISGRVRALEERVLKNSDCLVAISDRDRKQLLMMKEIRNITIPTGLNEYRYPTPREPEFPTLFYIGALDWMPNQEGITWFVDQVFPLVREKVPSIALHIAGRNAPAWLVHKFNGKRHDGINFHGEVDNAYQFMNRYAIFVSPLFTGSGIRIKILEGMMMQRVIVSTSIAAEGIPVSDRKNILITDGAESMAGIIAELCRDKTRYDEIARNSRTFVNENFNNFATSKRLSDFYRKNPA